MNINIYIVVIISVLKGLVYITFLWSTGIINLWYICMSIKREKLRKFGTTLLYIADWTVNSTEYFYFQEGKNNLKQLKEDCTLF